MVTKKIRTEYMKKFRDPKWETFSKCYEDSLKYRLTRRVMEHSHKPWFWDGWDSGSDSSGRSTPKLLRNKVAPLSVLPPTRPDPRKDCSAECAPSPEPKPPLVNGAADVEVLDVASPTEAIVENGTGAADRGSASEGPNTGGPSDDTDTGPVERASSDDDPVKPAVRRRRRCRTPRSEPGHGDKAAPGRKPSRAKSQPAASTKEENRRVSSRLDRTEAPRQTPTADACVQTRRGADKRGSNPERRRARSADLEKTRKSELTVVDDRWMTEYMRCFSARLR